MSTKPSNVRGTRDFLPDTMAKRNYIFDTIKTSFQKYGFLPIETPAMETTQTLLGKYGEEGDRLIFKVLKRGEKVGKALEEYVSASKRDEAVSISLAEEALRYDLTVPFARFVVQNQNELSFPFKRYQIQPVWRADRPAKGRYREFYQCDADVIGTDSLVSEIDLICIMNEVFTGLKVPVKVEVNNRKVLSGLTELFNVSDKATELFVALDKIDKIGNKIYDELREKKFTEDQVSKIEEFVNRVTSMEPAKQLPEVKNIFQENEIEIGLKGVQEIEYIFTNSANLVYNAENKNEKEEKFEVTFNIALARGLNYYTGAIFEVKAKNTEFTPSICGGGRYDDLTALFGLKGMSGVGISFGADRIYDVLEELDLFPKSATVSTKVLFINFGEAEQKQSMMYAKQLREAGIACEVYPSSAKMKKQMKYANDRVIPYVVMIGSDELESGKITYKNMESGEQQTAELQSLITKLS